MRTHIAKPTYSPSSTKTKAIQKKDDRRKGSRRGHKTPSHPPMMTEWGSITNNVLRTLESENSSVSESGSTIQTKTEGQSTLEVSRPNQTGLPDRLKAGVENLSGYSLDAVRVHYNSPKPAQLQALAYTQGTEIHVASGQEKHLPHEAWHVVQQMQGRVKPTLQMKGVQINDDEGLEREADVMGDKGLIKGLEEDNQECAWQKKDSGSRHPMISVRNPVSQLGGAEWTPHDKRELIRKIGEDAKYAIFYTKRKSDDNNRYVEAWRKMEEDKTIYSGHVNIVKQPLGLVLHTWSYNASESGMLTAISEIALKLVVEDFSDSPSVLMSPAPGAATKKTFEMLSAKLGDPKIHEEAEELRKTRIKKGEQKKKSEEIGSAPQEDESTRIDRLQSWNIDFMPEHHLHLVALAQSTAGSQGLKIVGPAGGLVGFGQDDIEAHYHVIRLVQSLETSQTLTYSIDIPMKLLRKVVK